MIIFYVLLTITFQFEPFHYEIYTLTLHALVIIIMNIIDKTCECRRIDMCVLGADSSQNSVSCSFLTNVI